MTIDRYYPFYSILTENRRFYLGASIIEIEQNELPWHETSLMSSHTMRTDSPDPESRRRL